MLVAVTGLIGAVVYLIRELRNLRTDLKARLPSTNTKTAPDSKRPGPLPG